MDKKRSGSSINILGVFQNGFNLYTKNIVTALFLGLISAGVSFIFSSWLKDARAGGLSLLYIFRSAFTVSVSAILILYLHLKEQNKKADLRDAVYRFFSKYFLVTMVTALALVAIIIGGFIFFIIPGILFAIWFSQTYYFILLENKSPADALRASKRLTEGRRIAISVIFLIQGIISAVISAVVGKLFPDAAVGITAIFPGTFFWFVDYVL